MANLLEISSHLTAILALFALECQFLRNILIIQVFTVPSDYIGTRVCEYRTAAYNLNNALDVVMYDLLSNFDIDSDGFVDISISEEDLEVEAQTIEEIPFLWGPALIEVRIWR